MKKEQFFALYWGQKVWRAKSLSNTYKVGDSITLKNYKDAYLSLRSISQLTDEEAIETAKQGYSFFKDCAVENRVVRELSKISIASFRDNVMIVKIQVNDLSKINYWQIKYLISIGILLDQTAIEKGWAIVKEI